jgi:hypothetical protein
MACQKCGSDRVAKVSGKTSDMCSVNFAGKSQDDYVPGDMGIGSGDYLRITYCLDCGQLQGKFPLELTEMETPEEDENEE